MTQAKRPAALPAVGLNPDLTRKFRDDLRGPKLRRSQMREAVESEIVELENQIRERQMQIYRLRVWLSWRCEE